MEHSYLNPTKKYDDLLEDLAKNKVNRDSVKWFGSLVDPWSNLDTTSDVIAEMICRRYAKSYAEKSLENGIGNVYEYCATIAGERLAPIFNYVFDINHSVKNKVHNLKIKELDNSLFGGNVRTFNEPNEEFGFDLFEYFIILDHIVVHLPLITYSTNNEYVKNGGNENFKSFPVLKSISLLTFNGKGVIIGMDLEYTSG